MRSDESLEITDNTSYRLKRSLQIKSLHLWGALVPMVLTTTHLERHYHCKTVYTGVRARYGPIHILHLLQQHGFVVEESAVQTFYQLKTSQITTYSKEDPGLLSSYNPLSDKYGTKFLSQFVIPGGLQTEVFEMCCCQQVQDELIFHEKINCLTFKNFCIFCVLLLMEYWFVRFANHCILYLFL